MGEQRRRTRVNSKISQLPDSVKELVDVMLRDTSNTYSDISSWLCDEGYEISRSAVGRYAIRMSQATQRVAETLEKMRVIVKTVEQNPDIDYTKASRIMMMDGLLQKVATAEEEFQEMPLDKAGRLIASLSRAEIYNQKAKHDVKSKIELAFDGLETELTAAIKSDPALTKELHSVLQRAREKLITDD